MPNLPALVNPITSREPVLKWFDDDSDINGKFVHAKILDTYLELAQNASQSGEHDLAKRMLSAARAQTSELEVQWQEYSDQSWKLAKSYLHQQKYQRAESVVKQSLATAERILGKYNHELSIEMERLAEIAMMRGDFAEAHRLYKRIIGLTHRKFGRRHERLVKIFRNFAHITEQLGNTRRATFIREAADRIERSASNDAAFGADFAVSTMTRSN